jgi:pyruvate/2-oxoacid:ferredoxin oxidoreductase beta subunit
MRRARGCGMLVYNYFDIDTLESAHGRGAAVATGIKGVRPDNLVFSYQGMATSRPSARRKGSTRQTGASR